MSGASGRGADDVTSRSTEQRFQAIFDSSPIGMALVGTDLKFQEVKPALCDMLGYTNIELTTLGVLDVPPPGETSVDLDLLRRVFAGDLASRRMERRFVRRDGQVIHISLTASRGPR